MERSGFITVANECTTEFTEKKSRFISSCFVAETAEEAERIIASVRAKYPDATHTCYAYVTERGAVQRFSDDGEPSGTAGMPILNVINRLSVTNTLVTVTRYFGGIKLGAGGLVRAYTGSAADVMTKAGRITYVPGSRGTVEVDYDDYAVVERMLLQQGNEIENKTFGKGVVLTVVTVGEWDALEKAVTDICRGGAICEFEKNVYVKERENESR